MRPAYLIAATLSALLLGSGCSMKKSFTPDDTVGSWKGGKSLKSEIIDVNSEGGQFENGRIVTRDGILDVTVPEGYRFIGVSDGRAIAATVEGTMRLIPLEGAETEEIELKKSVAGAALSGDVLAVLFADNSMALYSMETKQPIMKENGSPAVAVDNRIVNPHFLKDLVLFPTLDGKVVIVHVPQKKMLRSMIVSSEEHFNNIIYFKVIENTIVAATPTTLFAFSDREVREKYDLRDVAFSGDGVWLTTKQGEVVALTPSLQLKAKQKFPFAHFIGMIVTEEYLYLLEEQGYLIKLDKKLERYEVYDADVEEGYVYAADKVFYFDSRALPVE